MLISKVFKWKERRSLRAPPATRMPCDRDLEKLCLSRSPSGLTLRSFGRPGQAEVRSSFNNHDFSGIAMIPGHTSGLPHSDPRYAKTLINESVLGKDPRVMAQNCRQNGTYSFCNDSSLLAYLVGRLLLIGKQGRQTEKEKSANDPHRIFGEALEISGKYYECSQRKF